MIHCKLFGMPWSMAKSEQCRNRKWPVLIPSSGRLIIGVVSGSSKKWSLRHQNLYSSVSFLHLGRLRGMLACVWKTSTFWWSGGRRESTRDLRKVSTIWNYTNRHFRGSTTTPGSFSYALYCRMFWSKSSRLRSAFVDGSTSWVWCRLRREHTPACKSNSTIFRRSLRSTWSLRCSGHQTEWHLAFTWPPNHVICQYTHSVSCARAADPISVATTMIIYIWQVWVSEPYLKLRSLIASSRWRRDVHSRMLGQRSVYGHQNARSILILAIILNTAVGSLGRRSTSP